MGSVADQSESSAPIVIAIDGPAGAGKSTVGRELASRLGLAYLDTGAQFRAVGVAVLHGGLGFDDHESCAKLASSFDTTDDGHVWIDGVDYTSLIRSPEAGQAASRVAVIPAVRANLAARQRSWADAHGGGVIEGRDIGSVVFPDATLKLYITATAEIRGARRSAETGEELHDVIAAIRERDHRDKNRDAAPLTAASGSIRVDTSERPVDEIVDEILELLKERL